MTLPRRSFLASALAAMALDPERLLWRPGAKFIRIPKPRLPGAVVTMSAVGWPGAGYGRIAEMFQNINQFRGSREMLEFPAGQRIVSPRDHDGQLRSCVQVVLLPEGERNTGRFVDTTHFQQITLT